MASSRIRPAVRVTFLLAVVAPLLALGAECPCEDQSLCKPLQAGPRKELVAWSLDQTLWPSYNLTRVTTLGVSYHDPKLICHAHAHNVRVVYLSNLPAAQLTNASYRSWWVGQRVTEVRETFADGVNLDFEESLPAGSAGVAGLTALVRELFTRMKAEVPSAQISIDVGWSPACIDGRCYDVRAIAPYVDLMIVMSYDESSQIMGPCVAMANSPPLKTFQGILEYRNYGIPPSKLVMGVPWYGYDYPCLKINSLGECELPPDTWRGVACSDAVGKEIDYGSIYPYMVEKSFTGRVWNSTLRTPYFSYRTSSGDLHQVWYDDPQSLAVKFYYAAKSELQGLAVWNIDSVSYKEQDRQYTEAMYSAFDVFFDTV